MSLPKPPVALNDICSVIFNNTLYTYAADAFQALPLSLGAEWTQLPQGEKVTGGVCVGSTPADSDSAGFYVVGGTGTTHGYQGLQKYTYSTGKWESISLSSAVTEDRKWHGAVYLNSSDSILIYAGSQDGVKAASTQTFTVGASAPYAVSSYEDSSAVPAIEPILLPWSYTQGVFVGGSSTNTAVKLFSPQTSWVDGGASLADPFDKNSTEMKSVLVTGDDGSKSLYIFDLAVSPNTVERVTLINGEGTAVQDSAPITRRTNGGVSQEVDRRDSGSPSLEDWPEYNSTLAPTVTRNDYAVATGTNGLVVFAGGSSEEVLCIFNAWENKWENATSMLVLASTSESTIATATTTTASTGTSAAATTTSSSAAASSSSGLATGAVLGISLGSIFGLAFVLVLLYLGLERRRRNKASIEAGKAPPRDGSSSSEKDVIFASDSVSRGPLKGGFLGHTNQDSQGSFSAILMSRMKQSSQQSGGINRNPSNQTRRSSTSSILNRDFKSTISKPIPHEPEMMDVPPAQPADFLILDDKDASFTREAVTAAPRPRAATGSGMDRQSRTRRSSGWNRYWSGGSALNILGFGHGSGNGTASNSKRATIDSLHSSAYSDRSRFRVTQDSATVPPLTIYEPRASFSRVNTGSPTIAFHDSRLNEGLSGHIERPVSDVSMGSAYSSGIPESVHDAWDPALPGKPWGTDRAPSSAYSSGCTASFSPAGSSSRQPSQVPTGVSRQPQLAMAATSSDMSWLNLGDNNANSHV